MYRKLISVALPCRNEEENIERLVKQIKEQFEKFLPQYDYEIQFMDNQSTDRTREILRGLCAKDKHIKAIFNVKSFSGSAFHGILQTKGECCIYMASDFQDPPEMIPQFVKEWEQGYKIVCGIKESSSENKLMWWMRSLYYKLIQMNSPIKQIEHFTGFALYDRDFIEIMRSLQDSTPTLRGLVAEYGYKVKKINFHQPKRKKGKSSQNFFSLFDYAMRNFTIYTKTGLHLATLGGAVIAAGSVIIGCIYLVLKLIFWDNFSAGMAPLLIGMFFLGAVQIFFIGLVGEYVMSVNARVMKKPYAIEEERLNFDEAVKPEHIEYYHPSERKEKE